MFRNAHLGSDVSCAERIADGIGLEGERYDELAGLLFFNLLYCSFLCCCWLIFDRFYSVFGRFFINLFNCLFGSLLFCFFLCARTLSRFFNADLF